MLLETMTFRELRSEIFADLKPLEITRERLMFEYDRERRRLKTGKKMAHRKVYPIKTKRKNNWLFFLQKHPEAGKYKGTDSIMEFEIVYYYSAIGLRVFMVNADESLTAYNGHLYKRYNERMCLGLSNPVEVIKHYHLNNLALGVRTIRKEGKSLLLATCRDGLLLGELQEGDLEVFKTFITREGLSTYREETEHDLVRVLRDEIYKELAKPGNYPEDNKDLKGLLNELNGPSGLIK